MERYVPWGTALLTGTVVVLTALMLPLCAAAQHPAQVRQIAFLGLNFAPSASEPVPSAPAPTAFELRIVEEFRQGLRERGWVEGHNLAIAWRWAEGHYERFATVVDEVIRLQAEVIVGLCRKFCSGGREGVVTPAGGEIRRPGSRTVRPQ